MKQERKIKQLTPEELPKALALLDVENTTQLALIGPRVVFPNSFDNWPRTLPKYSVVFQLSECLSKISPELFDFIHLTSLNLSGNNISADGAQAIAKYLNHLTSLNLSHNMVGNDGVHGIAEGLSQLTSLNLSNNRVGTDGAMVISTHLEHLISLDLSGNHWILGVGAKAIAEHLEQLNLLNLSDNDIGDIDAKVIAEHLGKLTSLNLSHNKISDTGARYIAEHLGKLTSLNLSHNRISENGPRYIAEHLNKLISLNLGGNQIGYEALQAISHNLGNITSLYLKDSGISDDGVRYIAENLSQLNSIDLSQNEKFTNVEPLAELPLLLLNISNTGVVDLSPLKSMVLSGSSVKWSFRWEENTGIFVEGCPLKHPSPEIVQQGTEAVLNYFREIETQGTDQLFEAKLLIVGEGGAGKTSLLRRMFQPDMKLPNEDETTRGIDIYRHDFPINGGDRAFRLNAWDFGGQQIYHATHQFFLTKRSLYVLVDDTRVRLLKK